MPNSCEPRSVIDAAEQAAAAGDYASAEELLRDAARLQETDFGPLNPDLANTLNNLGIVCEFTNKPADAEHCYRKAHAIATAVLDPDHPFAVTSRKNLKDFCQAHGLLVEFPLPLPADAAEQDPQVAGSVWPQVVSSVGPEVVSSVEPHVGPLHAESRWLAIRGLSSRFPIVALSLCGVMLMVLMAIGLRLHSNGQADSSPVALTPPLESSAPTPDPVELIEARAAAAAGLTVVSATLCSNLSTGGPSGWRCDPASRQVDSGALFFYTRLKSPNDTRVQHRWYRGDRLYRAVNLRVRPNEADGYRTYTRYTMNSQSAGNWRVELRSRDGILLHEEQFVVR